MGSYGKVELVPHRGKHLGTGQMIDFHNWKVFLEGEMVGLKSKHFSSAVQWTSKIPSEVQDYVVDELRELLGDCTIAGKTIGVWDDEVETNEDDNKGDQLDDIFN